MKTSWITAFFIFFITVSLINSIQVDIDPMISEKFTFYLISNSIAWLFYSSDKKNLISYFGNKIQKMEILKKDNSIPISNY
jgi:hypothetical protein